MPPAFWLVRKCSRHAPESLSPTPLFLVKLIGYRYPCPKLISGTDKGNDVETSRKRGSRCLLKIVHQCIGISPVAKPLSRAAIPTTTPMITMIIATRRQKQSVATEIAKIRSTLYLIDFELSPDSVFSSPVHCVSEVISRCCRCHQSSSGICSSTDEASSICPP